MVEIHATLQAKAEKADRYLISKGFDVCQINGQRVSINNSTDMKPELRSEVFVGKIPRESFEDHLLPKFEMAGRVFKIRLMMDFSGTNRGFGFVKYFTHYAARKAVHMLNGIKLCEFHPEGVAVLPSFDNKGLYFDNLPANCAKPLLLKCLHENLRDVVNVNLLPPRGSIRAAEVFFKTHEAACSARRLLVPGEIKILDCTVKVDWAKPTSKSGDDISENLGQILIDQNNNSICNTSVSQEPQSVIVPHNGFKLNGVASYEPKPLSPDNILGIRGQAILQGCNDFDQRYLVVCNINLKKVSDDKLTLIFELCGRLQILSILHLSEGVAAIEYANVDQPLFMLETMVLVPDCFNKLAVPGHTLSTYLSSLTSLKNYIPRGYSITHF